MNSRFTVNPKIYYALFKLLLSFLFKTSCFFGVLVAVAAIVAKAP